MAPIPGRADAAHVAECCGFFLPPTFLPWASEALPRPLLDQIIDRLVAAAGKAEAS